MFGNKFQKCFEIYIYLTLFYNNVLFNSSAIMFCSQRCELVSQGRIYVMKTVEIVEWCIVEHWKVTKVTFRHEGVLKIFFSMKMKKIETSISEKKSSIFDFEFCFHNFRYFVIFSDFEICFQNLRDFSDFQIFSKKQLRFWDFRLFGTFSDFVLQNFEIL